MEFCVSLLLFFLSFCLSVFPSFCLSVFLSFCLSAELTWSFKFLVICLSVCVVLFNESEPFHVYVYLSRFYELFQTFWVLSLLIFSSFFMPWTFVRLSEKKSAKNAFFQSERKQRLIFSQSTLESASFAIFLSFFLSFQMFPNVFC